MTTELCRAPEDAALTCLRDLDALDEPLDARIGIAPDVSLLVPGGTVVGWNPTDPVRYVTTGFAAPDPAPPARATRLVFMACRDLATAPWLDAVRRRDPAAVSDLRELLDRAGCAANARTGTASTPCSRSSATWWRITRTRDAP